MADTEGAPNSTEPTADIDRTAGSDSGEAGDGGASKESPARDKLYQVLWTSLRGWVVIAIVAVLFQGGAAALERVRTWFEPFFETFGASALSLVFALAILILVPWGLGLLVDLLHVVRIFRRQRSLQAFHQMEKTVASGLGMGHSGGRQVALVNWPNAENRSLGLIVARFPDPETERALAAVYIAGTPDPTKGSIKVVPAEGLTPVEWDLRDLVRFHLTFGTAWPVSTEAEESDA